MDFSRGARIFKAMADETRVKIIHILSCGELCACDLLDYFDLTQPTLSHHLSILVEAGLIASRPEGKWTHYRLNDASFAFLGHFMKELSGKNDRCLCKKTRRSCT